ncbi:MAG TPA: acyltransferase [Micromonosporaceae bacterium]|nr:acyltransferase [Micromonosporaceae bacterium]
MLARRDIDPRTVSDAARTDAAGAPAPREPEGSRLGFLDVLRGVAALAVALYHLANQGPVGTSEIWWASHTLLNLGSFGVLLFFVVSGFIIPASLERTNSLRDFWISRGFRLFPLFWVVSFGVVALYALRWIDLPGYIFQHMLKVSIANGSMLAHFLGQPFFIGPAWTLPFEMCFYLLTTVFFVTRIRRASVGIALGGAALALVASDSLLTTWPVTPDATGVPGHVGNPVRVAVVAVAFAAVVALLAMSARVAGYAAVIGLAAAVLLMNRPWPLHQAVIYITVMFTGTVIYRVYAGQLSPRRGWVVVVTVVAAASVSYWRFTEPLVAADGTGRGAPDETWWTRSVALVAAVAVFATFFALRDRVRWPAVLRWLGRVSYSFYLVHWVVMKTVPAAPAGVPARGLLTFLVWLGVALAVSQLTYRFVEQPAIDAGRRLTRWLRARDRQRADGPAVPAQHPPVPVKEAV